MTPARFERCLLSIGWSTRFAADRLGVPESRLRRWAAGRFAVPEAVAAWLERLASAHDRNPPPPMERALEPGWPRRKTFRIGDRLDGTRRVG